jgi:hypothetical protein
MRVEGGYLPDACRQSCAAGRFGAGVFRRRTLENEETGGRVGGIIDGDVDMEPNPHAAHVHAVVSLHFVGVELH